MTPEAIVRALAAATPMQTHEDGCALCSSWETVAALHEHDCPWRLAVEWVAENPTPDGDMTVHVVTEWEWGGGGDDGHLLVGVYSTAELAAQAAAQYDTVASVPLDQAYRRHLDH